jgi:excisionase family DNA binding protein
MSDVQPLALTPNAAARYIGVSKRTIYNLTAAGRLTTRKLGRQTLVDAEQVRASWASLPLKDTPEPQFPGKGG